MARNFNVMHKLLLDATDQNQVYSYKKYAGIAWPMAT